MDDAHLPPLRFLSERRRCRAPQMDFLIPLFAGTSLKLRPRGYLNAGVASDSRLSRAGKTKDIGKAGIMRCQAGHAVIVNHIYSCAAGTPPPCFQEYQTCSCSGRSNESTPSLTEMGGGGRRSRPGPHVHVKGALGFRNNNSPGCWWTFLVLRI